METYTIVFLIILGVDNFILHSILLAQKKYYGEILRTHKASIEETSTLADQNDDRLNSLEEKISKQQNTELPWRKR